VIQNKPYNEREIVAKWNLKINKRLIEDKIIATRIKRNRHTFQKARDTWEKALEKQYGDLPHMWMYETEVLVGRRSRV
jgi:hypothetical protein